MINHGPQISCCFLFRFADRKDQKEPGTFDFKETGKNPGRLWRKN